MCVQVTKTANRFEISSLLEKILLKQVRWWLTFVGLYVCICQLIYPLMTVIGLDTSSLGPIQLTSNLYCEQYRSLVNNTTAPVM